MKSTFQKVEMVNISDSISIMDAASNLGIIVLKKAYSGTTKIGLTAV